MNPEHAPINATDAFEIGSLAVTLGYLLWAIAKAERKGSHQPEVLLTLDDKWAEAEAMLAAYADLLEVGDALT